MRLWHLATVRLALLSSTCLVAACGANADDTSNTPGSSAPVNEGADENASAPEYEAAAENETSQLGSSDGDCISPSSPPRDPRVKGEETHTIPTPPGPFSSCAPIAPPPPTDAPAPAGAEDEALADPAASPELP